MIIKMKQPKEESSWEVFQRWQLWRAVERVTFHQEFILFRFEPKYQHLRSKTPVLEHSLQGCPKNHSSLINLILLFISHDEKLWRALQNDSNHSEIKWNSISKLWTFVLWGAQPTRISLHFKKLNNSTGENPASSS